MVWVWHWGVRHASIHTSSAHIVRSVPFFFFGLDHHLNLTTYLILHTIVLAMTSTITTITSPTMPYLYLD